MNALETRAAALAAFRDGDSGNTALEGCVRASVCRMAGFVRVARAPALVAGGGLAFAESALDHAELKIPNVTLMPGRIPRQRHHPGLQSQHSVTTGATPPSASRTTTSPRATEVTLAVASGTESRIGSPAAAMAVRHLEGGILHSRGPTLSVRQLCPGRSPRLAVAYQVAVFIEACSRAMWPLFPPPGQRAPEFFTEQNGGRPMTRAMEQGMDAPARVLRLPRVQARTGLARSTIYVRVADGSFPQPIRLGARAVGWIESEVDAWIREQIAASRGNAK